MLVAPSQCWIIARQVSAASRPSALRHQGGVGAVSQSPAWLGPSVGQSRAPGPAPEPCYPPPPFVTSFLAPAQSIRKPGRRRDFLFHRRP